MASDSRSTLTERRRTNLKKKMRFLFLSIMVLSILWGSSIASYATNQNHAGGQVTVGGKITFEEKTTTPSFSTDDSDISTSSDKSIFKKNLPNTGEKNEIIYVVSGVLLITLLIFFIIKKRRQRNER